MKKTVVEFDKLDTIKIGVDKLADAVKSTLGPGGKGVIIKKNFAMPFITKDGVTVAQSVFLEDPTEDIGAQLVKEVASKTVDGAGDGTTSATILAQAIFNYGLVAIRNGSDLVEVQKGMDIGVKMIVENLKSISRPVKEKEVVKQVALISSNYDEQISEHIADAVSKIGENGYIAAEESNGIDTYVKITEGMQLERGFLSPHFVNNVEKMLVEYENPFLLITDKRISSVKEIMPVLEITATQGRPLIIIAEEVEGEALTTLVINKNKGSLRVCAVRCPFMGGQKKILMEDIAIKTGAQVISEEAGFSLDKVKLEDLGKCAKISISRDTTVIIDGGGDKEKIDSRIAQIKQEIEICKDEYELARLKTRLAKIDGGVAIIYVGGHTETAMRERKYRVDDAVCATISASEEGIVPGGGIALLRCWKKLDSVKLENDDQNIGLSIIKDAIRQPFKTICSNRNVPSNLNIMHIFEEWAKVNPIEDYGWDARKDVYGSMFDMGIVDPTKVVRLALENAASIMSLLLNTKASIYEKPEVSKIERLSE